MGDRDTGVAGLIQERLSRWQGTVVQTGEASIDAASLLAAAGGVSRALTPLPDDGPVVVLAADGIQLATAVLGTLAAGRPAFTLDRSLGLDRLEQWVREARAVAVLAADEQAARRVADRLADARVGAQVIGLGSLGPAPLELAAAPTDRPALVGTTSGSTGHPRMLVQRNHQLMAAMTAPGRRRMGQSDRFGMLLGATAGAVRRLLDALGTGTRVTCLDARLDPPRSLLDGFVAADVTSMWLVPTYLRRLLTAVDAGPVLPRLRMLSIMSEPLTWQDVADIRSKLSARCAIRHSYGASELGTIAEHWVEAATPLSRGIVPVGEPIARHRVRIVAGGAEVPVGEPGEITVESREIRDGVMVEALDDGRYRYRTGDLGRYRPDGTLEVLGRVDRMVKIGGIRVQPSRIEAVIRDLPWVREVSVLPAGVTTTTATGLIAHVHGSPPPGTEAADAIREHLHSLVHPAEIPDRVVMHPEPLPTLPSGKLDTHRLLHRG